MEIRGFSILCLGLLFLSACNPKKLDKMSYLDYVNNPESELIVEKEIAPYHFTLQYKPIDLVTLTEFHSNEFTEKEYLSMKEQFSGLHHFKFSIRRIDNKNVIDESLSTEDQLRIQEYFSYFMKNDICLVSGEDSLKCKVFLSERTYGLSPEMNFVLGFDKQNEKLENDLIFIYNDQLLNTAVVKMKIKKSKINKSPILKLN
jgi:hypothetical protein